jgi:hypothetical protein
MGRENKKIKNFLAPAGRIRLRSRIRPRSRIEPRKM